MLDRCRNPFRLRDPMVAACCGACLSLSQSGLAQIREPNAVGVSMGHLHFFVDDVAANQEFWVALGGTSMPFAAGVIVQMPGVLILISEVEADDGVSVLDHVAFRVESLDAIEALGFELERIEAFPGIASIYTPSGDRVELFEEGTATNVGFELAGDLVSNEADRHNRPLVGALDSHHLHFYVPEDQVSAARDWYVEHFGAVSGVRWRYEAADLPGMNLNFSASDDARAPTSGRTLDHIGFEIEGLEAFYRRLEAIGVEFQQPFNQIDSTLAVAILTDPWGTTIELTEGLTAY